MILIAPHQGRVERRLIQSRETFGTSSTCLMTGRAKVAVLIAQQFGEVVFIEPHADPEKDDVGDRVVKKKRNSGHDDTLSKGPRTMSHRLCARE
jgi:hypothetical protein